jgi:hypothetical protein
MAKGTSTSFAKSATGHTIFWISIGYQSDINRISLDYYGQLQHREWADMPALKINYLGLSDSPLLGKPTQVSGMHLSREPHMQIFS